jgi:hypothetical protein
MLDVSDVPPQWPHTQNQGYWKTNMMKQHRTKLIWPRIKTCLRLKYLVNWPLSLSQSAEYDDPINLFGAKLRGLGGFTIPACVLRAYYHFVYHYFFDLKRWAVLPEHYFNCQWGWNLSSNYNIVVHYYQQTYKVKSTAIKSWTQVPVF